MAPALALKAKGRAASRTPGRFPQPRPRLLGYARLHGAARCYIEGDSGPGLRAVRGG
jgi:hypothetical protein